MDWSILIDTVGASSMCAVSPEYVRRLCRFGVLSGAKFGGRWVMTLESVKNYLLKKGLTITEIQTSAKRALRPR